MNDEKKTTEETGSGDIPIRLQWTLAGIALALSAWFGWMMF